MLPVPLHTCLLGSTLLGNLQTLGGHFVVTVLDGQSTNLVTNHCGPMSYTPLSICELLGQAHPQRQQVWP